MTCTIDGCEAPRVGRGWCKRHWARWRRLGTTDLPAKERKLCTIDGCERPAKAHGWCHTHCERFRRNGTTEIVERPKVCTFEGCDKPVQGRGLCNTHYQRWVRRGDPAIVLPVKVDVPGYYGAHWRVRQARGPATGYACVGCGGPARDWAYDHSDPDELHQEMRGWGRQLLPAAYSLDVARYQPMCGPCHMRYDQGREAV